MVTAATHPGRRLRGRAAAPRSSRSSRRVRRPAASGPATTPPCCATGPPDRGDDRLDGARPRLARRVVDRPPTSAIKVLTQNLADVAAMGAPPTALLVSLVADPATSVEWAVDFARRPRRRAAASRGRRRAGGDLSSAPAGVLVVSVTALGDLGDREPVLRSGARAGDVVAVCGTLGRRRPGWPCSRAGADPRDPAARHTRLRASSTTCGRRAAGRPGPGGRRRGQRR